MSHSLFYDGKFIYGAFRVVHFPLFRVPVGTGKEVLVSSSPITSRQERVAPEIIGEVS